MTTDTSSLQSASTKSRLRPQSSYASSLHSSSNTHTRPLTPSAFLRPESYNYTAVDPYAASISQSIQNLGYSHHSTDSSLEDVPDDQQPQHPYLRPDPSLLSISVKTKESPPEPYNLATYIAAFAFDTVPRLLYSYILLRLPSLYFSRVARVFEDADLTMPEIKRMALELATQYPEDVHHVLFASLSSQAPPSSPFWNLKTNWESFIECLLREWKTLNIISVLLLTAILTVLQIDVAANDPLTRYSALLSLVCGLMSLLYGCIFIIRFGGMKKPHKAAEWAWEARRTRTIIWWNVWVMLAMPSIWLSWSVIAYIVCIMAFVWRTGSTADGRISPLEPQIAFWPRLVISLMFALGAIYFGLITATLSRYGSKMDRKWRERVKGWTDRLIYQQPFPEHITTYPHIAQWNASIPNAWPRKNSDDSYMKPSFVPSSRFCSRSPSPILIIHEDEKSTHEIPATIPARPTTPEQHGLSAPLRTFKAIELRFYGTESCPLPQDMEARNISQEIWARFINETTQTWNEPSLPSARETTPQASVLRTISLWNASVFAPLCLEAVICQEYYPEWPESPLYAIYFVDRQPVLGRVLRLEERFGPVPMGLIRIDVLDFSNFQHNWVTLFPERDTEVHFSPQRPIPPRNGVRRNSTIPGVRIQEAKDDDQDEDHEMDERSENEQDTDASHTTNSLISRSRRPPTPSPGSRIQESPPSERSASDGSD